MTCWAPPSSTKKDLSGAATAFQKSAELDKNNSEPLLKLAQVQAAMGSTDEAIATCRGALANHPNEPGFYILLGDLYQGRRDWSGATEAYQKALAIRPDNPMASNDLASVMLQSGGNLDVALSLAQTARRGMPRSPGVADTLGWIYYQKGAYHSAVDSLQEALRLAQEASSPGQSSASLPSRHGVCKERTSNSWHGSSCSKRCG